MAPKEKDESKGSTTGPAQDEHKERSLKDAASGFIDEVEKTGSTLIDEVRHLFESLSNKVSGVAGAAVDTTSALAQKVGKEPAHFIGSLLKEVQEAGEASVKAISTSFEVLRERVMSRAGEQAAEEVAKAADEKAAKKKAAKKKVTAKKAVKKSAARPAVSAPATKKVVAKKATTKKAATKKATTKKVVSKKKALAKKATTKKATSKKKVVAKKAPAAGGVGSG